MSLLGGLIGIADSLTKSFGLQATITYEQFLAEDGSGRRSYAAPIVRTAVYERKVKQVRKFDGEMGISNAQLVFLDATQVSEFDKIVLPDGTTQPIIGLDAVVDDTNGSVVTQIYLG